MRKVPPSPCLVRLTVALTRRCPTPCSCFSQPMAPSSGTSPRFVYYLNHHLWYLWFFIYLLFEWFLIIPCLAFVAVFVQFWRSPGGTVWGKWLRVVCDVCCVCLNDDFCSWLLRALSHSLRSFLLSYSMNALLLSSSHLWQHSSISCSPLRTLCLLKMTSRRSWQRLHLNNWKQGNKEFGRLCS